MTEKVKVTREQAEAIEEFQKTVHELGISLDESTENLVQIEHLRLVCPVEKRLDVNNND